MIIVIFFKPLYVHVSHAVLIVVICNHREHNKHKDKDFRLAHVRTCIYFIRYFCQSFELQDIYSL